MEPASRPAAALPRSPTFAPRRRSRLWWLVPVAVAGAAAVSLRARQAPPAPRYLTAAVTRGDLVETVRATGTVQPVQEVSVGAQVNGRVARVLVDYNSRVRAGDLLAELDPSTYRAQAAQGRASLASARAQLSLREAEVTLAERNLTRAQGLRAQGLNAPADLDSVLAARDSARASVRAARAQVEQAAASLAVSETNLALTRIVAPIDGVVATRAIDPGQTVVASLQSPTLFVIDNDLAHMRVIANVDEANIGRLSEGLTASVAVDAFPRETFGGTLTSLRITPITTNGVVTYQSVVAVENPALRLRPGMTATVSLRTQHHAGVLRVPNAALRYRPAARPGAADAGVATRATPAGESAVWVVRGGVAERVPVRTGLTDGAFTEVEGAGLTEGAAVVLDETDAPGAPAQHQGPPRML